MNLGDKIRRARIAKDMSGEELGRLIGVSRSAVNQWENGQVTNITLTNRIALSEHLGIPITELIPESATGDDKIVRDPQIRQAVEILEAMPPQLREACIRLLMAMRDREAQVGPPKSN